MARRRKLTTELISKLVEAIQIGCTYKHACEYAGIADSTFYGWMENGRNLREKSKTQKIKKTNQIYIEFLETIEKAKAKNVIANLAIIQRAAKDKNWQAAAWILERRHGMIRKEEEKIQTQINITQVDIEQLLLQVREQEHLIHELISDPVIDLDE